MTTVRYEDILEPRIWGADLGHPLFWFDHVNKKPDHPERRSSFAFVFFDIIGSNGFVTYDDLEDWFATMAPDFLDELPCGVWSREHSVSIAKLQLDVLVTLGLLSKHKGCYFARIGHPHLIGKSYNFVRSVVNAETYSELDMTGKLAYEWLIYQFPPVEVREFD